MRVNYTIACESNSAVSLVCSMWEEKGRHIQCGPRADICTIESHIFKHKAESRPKFSLASFYYC